MLFVDQFEPYNIWELLTQSVPVTQMVLNHGPIGYADYLWFANDGHRIQVERKQIDEILSDMDKVEEQLQRELGNGVEETILLIERICEPVCNNPSAVQSYNKPLEWQLNILKKILKHEDILVPTHIYNVSYTGLQAWKSQLDKCGITIVETFDWRSTAHTLVALYRNSLKQEHTTLRRYIKDKITTTERNPHILNLMGIKDGGVGEEIAKALIVEFGTIYCVMMQDVGDLADVRVNNKRFGETRARKLLKAFGRDDI